MYNTKLHKYVYKYYIIHILCILPTVARCTPGLFGPIDLMLNIYIILHDCNII